jgi:hypothetical protein
MANAVLTAFRLVVLATMAAPGNFYQSHRPYGHWFEEPTRDQYRVLRYADKKTKSWKTTDENAYVHMIGWLEELPALAEEDIPKLPKKRAVAAGAVLDLVVGHADDLAGAPGVDPAQPAPTPDPARLEEPSDPCVPAAAICDADRMVEANRIGAGDAMIVETEAPAAASSSAAPCLRQAVRELADKMMKPGEWHGLLSVVSFIAFSKLPLRLVLDERGPMDPLDWVSDGLRAKILSTLLTREVKHLTFCQIKKMGDLQQVFLPTSLLHGNHWSPLYPCEKRPSAAPHDPCNGRFCGTEGFHLCQSPLVESTAPMGYLPYPVLADGDCLLHSILHLYDMPSGLMERLKLATDIAAFLNSQADDPDWQQSVILLNENPTQSPALATVAGFVQKEAAVLTAAGHPAPQAAPRKEPVLPSVANEGDAEEDFFLLKVLAEPGQEYECSPAVIAAVELLSGLSSKSDGILLQRVSSKLTPAEQAMVLEDAAQQQA